MVWCGLRRRYVDSILCAVCQGRVETPRGPAVHKHNYMYTHSQTHTHTHIWADTQQADTQAHTQKYLNTHTGRYTQAHPAGR